MTQESESVSQSPFYHSGFHVTAHGLVVKVVIKESVHRLKYVEKRKRVEFQINRSHISLYRIFLEHNLTTIE